MTQKKTIKINQKLLEYEKTIWSSGIVNIAGIDEVGRGALAGPLVVAAVVLEKSHFHNELNDEIEYHYALIKDSKQVTPKRRAVLSEFIIKHAKSYSIQVIPHEVVDNVGIAQATQMGFFNAVKSLKLSAGHVLTDTFPINGLSASTQTNITKGDNKSLSIASASIIAKVYRDNMMVKLHEKYINYGFDKHKGYGTKAHKTAIEKHGPCKIHRTTFEPIKSYYANKRRIK